MHPHGSTYAKSPVAKWVCAPTCSCGSRCVLLARMLNAVSGRLTVSLYMPAGDGACGCHSTCWSLRQLC